MRERKREWMPLYSFLDRSAITAHLASMAEKGWMLESIGAWKWTYRRTEPRRLKFAVTYFAGAGYFSPSPAEGLDTFQDYCAQAGWQTAASWDQVQIFWSEDLDAVPLETDPETELQNIERSFGKPLLRTQLLLLALSLLETILQIHRVLEDPIQMLSSSTHLMALVSFLPMGILAAGNLLAYRRWRRRARAAAEAGQAIPDMPSARKMSLLIMVWAALTVAVTLAGLSHRSGMLFIMVGLLVFYAVIGVSANCLRKLLQQRRWPAWANFTAMVVLCILIFVVGMAGLFTAIPLMASSGLMEDREPVETYKDQTGWTWAVYADPIPLRIEDLADTDYDRWSTEARISSSPLLTWGEFSQSPRLDDGRDQPDLDYEVVLVKAPFLYDLCKESYIAWLERDNDQIPPEHQAEHWEEYRPIDPAPWGAEEAYQAYYGSEAQNRFLVCWPDRIAQLQLPWDWTLTEDMAAAAAEKLCTPLTPET